MSNPKLKYDKTKSAQQLQGLFNEVCFRLGQEIRNEARAIANQATLSEQQEELEKAYTAAVEREQAIASANKKADDNTASFESKGIAQETTTETT